MKTRCFSSSSRDKISKRAGMKCSMEQSGEESSLANGTATSCMVFQKLKKMRSFKDIILVVLGEAAQKIERYDSFFAETLPIDFEWGQMTAVLQLVAILHQLRQLV